MTIESFQGKYRFLSNFSYNDVVIYGAIFKTAEHAFQFSKAKIPLEAQEIKRASTPGQAKRLGRQVKLKNSWPTIRVNVMRGKVDGVGLNRLGRLLMERREILKENEEQSA